MKPWILLLSTIIGLDCALSVAAPLPEQLWVQRETRQCLSFFPGDENVSQVLNLPEPEKWVRYDIVPFSDTVLLKTPYGDCPKDKNPASRLIDCCRKLGLKPVFDARVRGWIGFGQNGFIPATSLTPSPVPSVVAKPQTPQSAGSLNIFFIVGPLVIIVLVFLWFRRSRNEN